MLQKLRAQYRPTLPSVLADVRRAVFQETDTLKVLPEIRSLFPRTVHESVLSVSSGINTLFSPLRVGIVLSGGPAPGGHAVIGALYDLLKELHPDSVVIGIEGGPDGILKKRARELTHKEINRCRYTGGFTLLGTSRKKIETEHELQQAEQFVQEFQLDGLVIVGGDDSNTNAAVLAERFSSCTVVGVPKTIDGDVQNAYLPISFGFDTACKTYSNLISNLGQDLLSSKKYYGFVRLMGRNASHITLECALETNPNMALIAEECKRNKTTLHNVVDQIVTLINERALQGKEYGLILIPEGLIESLSDVKVLLTELNHLFTHEFTSLKTAQERLESARTHLSSVALACLNEFPIEIEQQLVYERDPHGNISVSQIETERLLALLVHKQLAARFPHIHFRPLTAFYGYEGRSAMPSNFDYTLSSTLGTVAGLLIAHKKNGYMATVSNVSDNPKNWHAYAVPLTSLMHFEERKGIKKPVIAKTKVDVQGIAFTAYCRKRDEHRLQDDYALVSPIQFFGPYEEKVVPPKIVMVPER